jgi:hypothetical protein
MLESVGVLAPGISTGVLLAYLAVYMSMRK